MTEPELELVMAIIRPEKLGPVKQALSEVGAPSITATSVSGRGSESVQKEQWRGEEYTIDLLEKVKIECVVADIPSEDVVEAIADAAETGQAGDGRVFVLPVSDAHRIRTGETGTEAV